MHAGMAYLARDPSARESITRWFPAARSVILLGFSYAGPPSKTPAGGGGPDLGRGGAGRFARYALCDDYHPALKAKARELLAWLQTERPGTKGKVFVDTSPVLERLYARWAGLGWVGKNTMLLSPSLGSLFFLAGFAVDAELEPDQPVTDHCGACRRCLDACPTGAFAAPRVLDASRCIAYFTIEHRGEVPRSFREGVGDWVFGCDVCQDACPFSRFARMNPVFRPRLPERAPLEELAALDEKGFEERYGATPVERAGVDGLKRNALLAMGNSGETRFVPVLERFAGDRDPVLAEQARASLDRLRGLPSPSET